MKQHSSIWLGLLVLISSCLLNTSCLTTRNMEARQEIKPYPFDNCAVNRRPFGREGHKHRRVHEGYEVLFCCLPCVKAFDIDPTPWMPRIVEYHEEQGQIKAEPKVYSIFKKQ